MFRFVASSHSRNLFQSTCRSFANVVPQLSVIQHPHAINGVPLDADDKEKFAIIEFSGTQYKVAVDDVIVADKMEGVDIGQLVDIGKVMMVGARANTHIGHPYVEGAQVTATVEEITKDKKVLAFKMRRRKSSKRLKGFRRQLTILRINSITHVTK